MHAHLCWGLPVQEAAVGPPPRAPLLLPTPPLQEAPTGPPTFSPSECLQAGLVEECQCGLVARVTCLAPAGPVRVSRHVEA